MVTPSSESFSFRELIEAQVGRKGTRPFLTFAGRTWTGSETDNGANRVANALRELGVRKGDHVAVLLPNGPEIVWCWWGIAKLGAVYVPVNTQLVGESLAHVLRHSDAGVLIADSSLLERVHAALAPWPEALRHLVLARGAQPGKTAVPATSETAPAEIDVASVS